MTPHERFARMLQRLLDYASAQGIKVLLYWLFRMPEQQKALYDKKVSNCDGYKKLSKHQLGRAGDIAVVIDEKIDWKDHPEYKILGDYWVRLGGTWGGNWKKKDIFHFEV